MIELRPEYVSDIVLKAMNDKKMSILAPIIQKYDKLYKGKRLSGETYSKYVSGINTEYLEATKNEEKRY